MRATRRGKEKCRRFLSIQAQDFIEDKGGTLTLGGQDKFLSIQAQDFIEEAQPLCRNRP